MSKYTLTLLLAIFGLSAFAQNSTKSAKNATDSKKCPTLFITTSTGFNNSSGLLGVGAEYEFVKQVGADAGFGIGSWGYKMNLGFQYFFKPCHKGWTVGLGVTHCIGLSNYQTKATTIYGSDETVTLNLHPVTNFYVATHYYANLDARGRNRFYTMLGWSQALTSDRFHQTSGDPINDATTRAYNFISPGGLIVAIGFGFGLD